MEARALEAAAESIAMEVEVVAVDEIVVDEGTLDMLLEGRQKQHEPGEPPTLLTALIDLRCARDRRCIECR
jgi:hypothetical protein